MANLKLLIDTDIIIDCLKGIRAARELFRTQNIEVYCSVLSKKELFFKPGLTSSERKRILAFSTNVPHFHLCDMHSQNPAPGGRRSQEIEYPIS